MPDLEGDYIPLEEWRELSWPLLPSPYALQRGSDEDRAWATDSTTEQI